MRVILGSSSPRRLEIARRVWPHVEVLAPNIDEDAFSEDLPATLTLAIAMAKNKAVRRLVASPVLVVTADTLAEVLLGSGRREVRGKPHDATEAAFWLRQYRDHPVSVVTSVVIAEVAEDGGWLMTTHTDVARVRFTGLTDELIAQIVAEGTVLGCAGAFTMEHPLFAGHVIVRGDPETVQGLPSRFLRRPSEELASA